MFHLGSSGSDIQVVKQLVQLRFLSFRSNLNGPAAGQISYIAFQSQRFSMVTNKGTEIDTLNTPMHYS